MEFFGGFSVPPGNKRERRVWKLLPDGQVFRRNREPTKSVHLPAGLGHSSDLLPSDFIDGQSFPLRLQFQSSARSPSLVSIGAPSRISTRPSSISAVRSSGLTGDNFVRLALISRNAQRRRIAVSRFNPASTECGCSGTAFPLSPGARLRLL